MPNVYWDEMETEIWSRVLPSSFSYGDIYSHERVFKYLFIWVCEWIATYLHIYFHIQILSLLKRVRNQVKRSCSHLERRDTERNVMVLTPSSSLHTLVRFVFHISIFTCENSYSLLFQWIVFGYFTLFCVFLCSFSTLSQMSFRCSAIHPSSSTVAAVRWESASCSHRLILLRWVVSVSALGRNLFVGKCLAFKFADRVAWEGVHLTFGFPIPNGSLRQGSMIFNCPNEM